MKASLLDKLTRLQERRETLHNLLSDPRIIADHRQFRALSREVKEINPVVECFMEWRKNQQDIEDLQLLRKQDSDLELRALSDQELSVAQERHAQLYKQLQGLLLPRDPADEGNVFLEIRAGAGGEEAALFAGDLQRMYSRYAELRGWQTEMIHQAESEHQGFREVVLRIIGRGAYSRLKFESGTHRVQRVPETEAQGRIHTSTCTVAILPELSEMDDLPLESNSLRIDTFRASGAGGQHVNKTDSAIRITHIPTGVSVECQSERSQHKNKAQAMALLQARLLEAEREKQRARQAADRRNLIGSGDRSERIRTYNFPQGRVTDHRIKLTLYRLEAVLAGEMDVIVEPLFNEHRAEQLAAQRE